MGTRFLPFADAASADLPLGRILRLALFQVSVGLATVLLTGTLNRVMIVELHFPASIVALMVSLPLVFAPLRTLIGHKSDTHISVLGWKRVPYIWFGTLAQFGGFAILPFALAVMTGGGTGGPAWVGEVATVLAFLLIGAGMHTVQTAGLALATDLSGEDKAPRVVALLYVMQLAGILVASLVVGRLLADFSITRLVQVVQGAAVVTVVLNGIALWKQEARNPRATGSDAWRAAFGPVLRAFLDQPGVKRLLTATALGAAAYAMHDVLLEPYGGEVLGMSVGATTALTAGWAAGMIAGFAYSAKRIGQGFDAHRLAGHGGVFGIAAFLMIVFATPAVSPALLWLGASVMGVGGGMFAVGTLTAAMALSQDGRSGLALGCWGAVQATAAGGSVALGGVLRDVIAAHSDAATAYTAVYLIEIVLLLAMLIAIGPLVGRRARASNGQRFGLAEFPA